MKKNLILILIIPFLLFLRFPEQEDDCAKPKVVVLVNIGETALNHKLRIDYGDHPAEYFKTKIGDATTDELRSQSGDIDIWSIDRIYVEKMGDPDFFIKYPELLGALKADYLVHLNIYQVGGQYQLYMYLISIDSLRIVRLEDPSGLWLEDLLAEARREWGDLAELLKRHEAKYNVPPREPRMQATADPDTVWPRAGKDTSTIRVLVTDCRGVPVGNRFWHQKVYFEKETQRGRVNTEIASGYSLTRSDGVATATYKLDPAKGTEPGSDTIRFWTYGRGRKRYDGEIGIKIMNDGELEYIYNKEFAQMNVKEIVTAYCRVPFTIHEDGTVDGSAVGTYKKDWSGPGVSIKHEGTVRVVLGGHVSEECGTDKLPGIQFDITLDFNASGTFKNKFTGATRPVSYTDHYDCKGWSKLCFPLKEGFSRQSVCYGDPYDTWVLHFKKQPF